jgi:FKBP-type peptidyl-prolyl cis-trans isomerase
MTDSQNGPRHIRTVGLTLLAALLVVVAPAKAAPQETMPEVDAMTKTASGLFLRDDVVGTGEPAVLGDRATLSDAVWLMDGEQVFSDESTVTLGVTSLIPGFTEGLVGTRVGGTRTIVIPADLGYRSQGVGSIPDNAVLVLKALVTGLIRRGGC